MSMSAEGQFRLEGCTVLGANGFPFAAGGTLNVQFDERAVNFIGLGILCKTSNPPQRMG